MYDKILITLAPDAELELGKLKQDVLCDIIPMDVLHIILGRPW
jgi:hypothetical protein